MKMVDKTYNVLLELEEKKKNGVSAIELSDYIGVERTNVSRYLNQLFKEGKVEKVEGRPVLYKPLKNEDSVLIVNDNKNSLDKMVGAKQSLSVPIQQAKASVLYPPRGLHTLILGETGVGKSMFAELMYQFAIESKMIKKDSPFIRFNCADYSENPQLLIGQIFGVKKGSYTGADKDRDGLLKMADGGILFLDEIHRLSPQGQEMLFTYIDKGYFRPLGDTEGTNYAEVQIIAATTEDPKSYLLNTFVRRIPMIITLPALKDRSIMERYSLVETFIKEESKRVGKSIYMNKNSLISYLLYECPSNIGQLRSDIQLSCAKAFVNYKASNENYILINQSDIPHNVKKGLLKIKEYRNEIEQVLQDKGDILKFHYKEDKRSYDNKEYTNGEDFYSIIENKLESLKNAGLGEKEINEILNIDIESHFEKYLGNLPQKLRTEEMSKLVDTEILETVDKVLSMAKSKLCKEFDEKIYFGLSLHLQRSVERIRNGEKIYNPKLNFIRVNYENEFLIAMKMAKIIDEKFNIETPVDEIGYLVMFLASNPYEENITEQSKVGVLVIMHGTSTASSMVEVANSLVGIEYAHPLDMPLTMMPEVMYEIAKNKVIDMDKGKGVLILVDMGSLTNFGDMIYEETGIETKTIDLVSTPIVIDACRKAVMGHSIFEIYNSCKDIRLVSKDVSEGNRKKKDNIIITACFTGEGSSVRLKEIIEEKIDFKDIEIIALNLIDKNEFLSKVNQYEKDYNVLAIVGTIEIKLSNIPFIPAINILNGEGINKINEMIKEEDMYQKIGKSLNGHMSTINGEIVVHEVKHLIRNIEKSIDTTISDDVKMGIILHISFLIEKILNREKTKDFLNLDSYIKQYHKELKLIKICFEPIEDHYNISIGDDELAYICKLFLSNSIKE